MALFGEFTEAKESWPEYAERFEQFFDANDIAVDKKKSIFLSTIGPMAYHTLGNLVAPRKPQEETYANLLNLMSAYYNPKPLDRGEARRTFSSRTYLCNGTSHFCGLLGISIWRRTTSFEKSRFDAFTNIR